MASTSNIEQIIPDDLMKLAYQAFQYGKSSFSLAHKNISTQVWDFLAPAAKPETQPLSPELLQKFREKNTQLLEADFEDAQKGIYPHSLLFDNQWDEFFQYYPAVWLNLPDVWERSQNKQYQQFSPEIDKEGYPSYYLQNFHHQTDGYLSDFSANLYDLQVEILFNGTANAMRRRILAPLKEGLQVFQSEKVRVLDVACGTGRTLKFIRAALPKASLFGTDLSPAYLRKANQLLSENPQELPQLLQANAEELPYQDNYFHGVSCVFLFHELPPNVRQRVIEETFRVIKPGGVYVICDSIQSLDFPEFKTMMENFPVIFHEPYYKSYITDDLVKRLEKAGFVNIKTQNHLVSKYWLAQKPGL